MARLLCPLDLPTELRARLLAQLLAPTPCSASAPCSAPCGGTAVSGAFHLRVPPRSGGGEEGLGPAVGELGQEWSFSLVLGAVP